jgi:hypothetical protein
MRVSEKQLQDQVKQLEAKVAELKQRLELQRGLTRNAVQQNRIMSEIINNSNL